MTSEQILALQPGPDLDQAVHVAVFGGIGRQLRYSMSDAAGIKIIDRLPLFVGRIDPSHPTFDASRPFIAGTLSHVPEIKGDATLLRVTAPTRLVALCKAALLVVHRPPKVEQPAPQRSQSEQARDLAARVGTPLARNPKAARIPQPTSRVHARDKLPPLPKRTKTFRGPSASGS